MSRSSEREKGIVQVAFDIRGKHYDLTGERAMKAMTLLEQCRQETVALQALKPGSSRFKEKQDHISNLTGQFFVTVLKEPRAATAYGDTGVEAVIDRREHMGGEIDHVRMSAGTVSGIEASVLYSEKVAKVIERSGRGMEVERHTHEYIEPKPGPLGRILARFLGVGRKYQGIDEPSLALDSAQKAGELVQKLGRDYLRNIPIDPDDPAAYNESGNFDPWAVQDFQKKEAQKLAIIKNREEEIVYNVYREDVIRHVTDEEMPSLIASLIEKKISYEIVESTPDYYKPGSYKHSLKVTRDGNVDTFINNPTDQILRRCGFQWKKGR